MPNPNNEDVKWLYGKLKSKGYDIGSEQDFSSSLANEADRKWYYEKAKGMGLDMGSMDDFNSMFAPAKPAEKPQQQVQAANKTAEPNKPTTGAQPQQMTAHPQPTEQPKQEQKQPEKPKDTPMTEQQRIAAQWQLGQMMMQNNASMAQTKQRIKDIQTYGKKAPMGGKVVDLGKRYNVETGKMEDTYMTPTGHTTTNKAAAENVAHQYRVRQGFFDRMKENGLNTESEEDMQKQHQLDVEKPMRDAVNELWNEAEAKYKADSEASAKKAHSEYMSIGGGREARIMRDSQISHDKLVSRFTRFDLEKMMNDAWQRIGEDKRNYYTRMCYDVCKQREPNASETDLKAKARKMAREYSDSIVFQYAVEKNAPKNTLDFFTRKMADVNVVGMLHKALARSDAGTTGDMAARDYAMQEYGKDHKFADIAGTVTGMAVDPVTWISGGIGSMAGKGAMTYAGRFVLNGASKEVAARYMAGTLAGRMVQGVVGGAVNFGTFESLKNIEQQMLYGGYVNPETGENEGYSLGAVLGQGAHGLMIGGVTGAASPIIGNYADKAVKATSSTAGKVGLRVGETAVSTLAEGTIFSIPEWISGERDAADVWTDNMALMLGFKLSHGIKSAPRVLDALKTDGKRYGLSFEERLRKQMDASPADAGFTKEEIAELRDKGYIDLGMLFADASNKKANKAKRAGKPSSREVGFRLEDTDPYENLMPDTFDGYDAMKRLMNDKSVSEATRAKAYYILTGHTLPMSTITGYTTDTAEDGSVVVSSVSADGSVVTSRRFANEGKAQQEIDNIMRQAELNSVTVGEKYKEAASNMMVVETAIKEVVPDADMQTVLSNYKRVKNGEDLGEAYKQQAEAIDAAIERNKNVADLNRPAAIRERLKEETGVDVDASLRKKPSTRTAEEQVVVERYVKELFPEQKVDEATGETYNAEEARDAEYRLRIEERQQSYDEGRDAFAAAEQEGDRADADAVIIRMQEAREEIDRVFGDMSEEVIAAMDEDPIGCFDRYGGTSQEETEAMLYYVNSKAAIDGLMEASNESADGKRADVEFKVGQRTHKQSGMIHPATLKVDDRPVYIVSGNVVMFPDGSAVDKAHSSESVIIVDAESGEMRFIDPDMILKVDEPVSAEDELNAAYAAIDAEQQAIVGDAAGEDNVSTGNDVNAENAEVAEAEQPQLTQEGIDNAFRADLERQTGADPMMQGEQLQGALNQGAEHARQQYEAQQKAIAEADAQRKAEQEALEASALYRIPKDENGQPLLEQTDPETAWDGVVEYMEDEGDAKEYVDAMVKTLTANVKTAEDKVKKVTPGADMADFKAKKAKAREELEAVKARLAHWQAIAEVNTARQKAIQEQRRAELAARDAQRHDEAVAQLAEQKRIEAEKKAEQEAIGTHAVNPKIKAKWDAAPKVVGAAHTMILPDGTRLKGHYVLTVAGAATASHDVNNAFAPSEGFPVDENGLSVNDRDYQHDADAQQMVRTIADNYDGQALQDVVTVTNDGIVIDGNNRWQSGELAAKNNTDGQYLADLKAEPSRFGVTAEQIAEMEKVGKPRMTFVPDDALPYTADTFARFNAQRTKKQSKTEAAVKMGKVVDDKTFNAIAMSLGQYDSLSDFYGNKKASTEAVMQLAQQGVVNDFDVPALFDGEGLSSDGKNLLENVLVGKVFEGYPDAVRSLAAHPSMRQAVVMGMAEIAHNRTLAGGYGLGDELSAAVDLVRRAKAADSEVYKVGVPVSPFGRQAGLFDDEYGDSTVTDATTLLLADILNSTKPSDLRKVLASYNHEAAQAAAGQLDVFSGAIKTKEELLKDINEHYIHATAKEQQALVDAAIEERKRRAAEQTDAAQASGGQGELSAGDAERQSALAQAEERVKGKLSDEMNEFGKPFVKSTDGTIDFGAIDAESGLEAAPIRLSIGEDNVDAEGKRHGYGLLHIEAGHGEQIRDAGYNSVEEFVEEVAKHYDTIREGNTIADNKTYLLELTDGRNNTLFVQLSRDGSYWNVNSAGIFRERYSRNKRVVSSVPTMGASSRTEADGVNHGQEDGATVTSGNSPKTTSGSKDTETSAVSQEKGEKSAPIGKTFSTEEIEAQRQLSNTAPTEGQKKAGNYAMGHIKVDGYDITLENPKGSVRSGKDANGKEWSIEMKHDYGYIKGTEGVDGDHIDVYLSETPTSGNVYVVDQINQNDGSFDEHKVMYGFGSMEEAVQAYKDQYEDGWKVGKVTEVSREDFKKWVESSKRKTKPFAEYAAFKGKADSNAALSEVGIDDATINPDTGKPYTMEEMSAIMDSGDAEQIKRVEKSWNAVMAKSKAEEQAKVKNGYHEHRALIDAYKSGDKAAIAEAETKMKQFLDGVDNIAQLEQTAKDVSEAKKKREKGSADAKALASEHKLLKTRIAKLKKESALKRKEGEDLLSYAKRVAENEEKKSKEKEAQAKEAEEKVTSESKPSNGGQKDLFGEAKQQTPAEKSRNPRGRQILDYGEVIAGARKNALTEIAKSITSINVETLVTQPLSKVWKKPNLKKMVEDKAITEEEATFLEVITQWINQSKKPATLKSGNWRKSRREAEIRQWAEDTNRKLNIFKQFVEGTDEVRAAMLEQGQTLNFPNAEAEKAQIEQVKELNKHRYEDPEKEFANWGKCLSPNPVYVYMETLKRMGYKAGDKVDYPLFDINRSTAGDYYEAVGDDGKRSVILPTTTDVDEMIANIVAVNKVMRGDADAQIPESLLRPRVVTYKTVGDGTFHASYVTKYGGFTQKEFKTRAEAEKYATKVGGIVREGMKSVPDQWSIGFTDINGDKTEAAHVVKGEGGETTIVGDHFDSKEEAMQAIGEDGARYADIILEQYRKDHASKQGDDGQKERTFNMYYSKGGVAYMLSPKEAGSWKEISPVFKSQSEAKAWMKEHRAEVEAQVDKLTAKMKEHVFFTDDSPRVGKDWRGGKDITPEEFGKTFGFRGVQFGNWANDADRQAALNNGYDSLMDMAELMGISPRAVSLNGELGIAFGARGTGRANAHYELNEVVINLTKTRGAGSLAHEWWHALDNYFSRMAGLPFGMVTSPKSNYEIGKKNIIRAEVMDAYNKVVRAINESSYGQRQAKNNSSYWKDPVEMSARLLDAWVGKSFADNGQHNGYLTHAYEPEYAEAYRKHMYELQKGFDKMAGKESISYEEYRNLPESLGLYENPSPEEMAELAPVMRDFFDTLKEKESDNGAMLYESDEQYGVGEHVQLELFDDKGEAYVHSGSLPKLEEGDFSLVERDFNKNGYYGFSGGDVESADDIAYILRNLETKSVENAFAVFVTNGKPTVVHVGMGHFTATAVNTAGIRAAYDRIGADKVYFVHNHPSGKLNPSVDDRRTLQSLREMLPGKVEDGIIIDTLSGQYSMFGDSTYDSSYDVRDRAKGAKGTERSHEVLEFDKLVFSPDYDVKNLQRITGADDVAAFLSSQRLGDRGKVGVIVCNNAMQIVGNFHLPYGDISSDVDGLANEIVRVGLRYGGSVVIPYGNFKMNEGATRNLGERVRTLSGRGLQIVDVISRNTSGVNRSAAEEGWRLQEGMQGYKVSGNKETTHRDRERYGEGYDELNDEQKRNVSEYFDAQDEIDKTHVVSIPETTNVVNASLHPFNTKQKTTALKKEVEDYAEKNGIIGTMSNEETNGKGVINISKKSIGKFVDDSASDKSVGKDVHLSVLPVIRDVIRESFEGEVHPDVLKNDKGDRELGNAINKEVTIHRLFGAVNIDGTTYRVKITVKQSLNHEKQKGYSYEVTNIELPSGKTQGSANTRLPRPDNSISTAKLLKDVEKSYEKGKKLLEPNEKLSVAQAVSEDLNTPVHILTSADEVAQLPTNRMRGAKGWTNTATGEIVIVAPNNADVADIENTVVHEIVGHKGLRKLVGEENFDTFLDEVHGHAEGKIAATIDGNTQKLVDAETSRLESEYANDGLLGKAKARAEAEEKREQFRREATEEYMADIAGRIGNEGFKKMDAEEVTFWGKVKAKVLNLLDRLFAGKKWGKNVKITDKDIAYFLYKSWKNLKNGGKPSVMEMAEDAVMRDGTKFNATDAERFRDGMDLDATITSMKAEVAAKNTDDVKAKTEAMEAIGGNLSKLRKAMQKQKKYDISTAKSMKDLATTLMDKGLLDSMSKLETKQVLATMSNAVGKEDLTASVDKLMSVMVNNQLRAGEAMLGKLLSMKGTKLNSSGVQVKGLLDPEGDATLKAIKDYNGRSLDELDVVIGDLSSKLDDENPVIAADALLKYRAAQIARRYVSEIKQSKGEEKALSDELKEAKERMRGELEKIAFDHGIDLMRDVEVTEMVEGIETKVKKEVRKSPAELIKAIRDAGGDADAAKRLVDSMKELEKAEQENVWQNHLARVESYTSIAQELGSVLGQSVERAKAWVEQEKERVSRIHHLANSDMQGRALQGQKKETISQKLANNPLAQLVLQPLATFDQMLKMFGSKDANGEGYMQNFFMRNWVDAVDGEQIWKERYHRMMDAKASELFGKGKGFMDLYKYADAGTNLTLSFYDGTGQHEFELNQGQLMYLYAVEKMPMGKATNRNMGFTEDVMALIEETIDPRLKAFVDWVQDEMLPGMGVEIDKVYQRMFGAHMDQIDSYFPFVRYKEALKQDVENGQQSKAQNNNITTQTGALKKRQASVAVWDMQIANFLDVHAEHVQTMCHWANFAELNRDIGTLLSYNHFKQQVMGMSSVYGSGKELWKRFNEVCAIATDCYEPKHSMSDKTMMRVTKGVTLGKIAFRPYTAMKQALSLGAFFGEAHLPTMAKDMAMGGIPALQWAWKNMPNFRKRILSRTTGDYRLRETEYDTKIMKLASWGMLPNMGVDAWTIALGSHGVYAAKKAKYLRWGKSEEEAEHRAIQDAELCFNKSQQSSEGAFLAPIQVDRTFLASSSMLFRNSSTSYTREGHVSARNLANIATGKVSEEFMAKKWLRLMHPESEGAWSDEQWARARKEAKREMHNAKVKNSVNLVMFDWLLPFMWRLGSVAPLLLLTGDDDERKEQLNKTMRESVFAPVEGLWYGDIIGHAMNQATGLEEKNPWALSRTNPALGDLTKAAEHVMGKRWVEGAQEVVNIVGGMLTGINPQTLVDWTAAIMDASDDRDTQRETALLVVRLLNVPPSQAEKLYFEEIDLDGKEASTLSPKELCDRYARYKRLRGSLLTGWMYSDEAREEAEGKTKQRGMGIVKDKLERKTDGMNRDELQQYREEAKATGAKESRLNKIIKTSDDDDAVEAANDALDKLIDSPAYGRYLMLKEYNRDVKDITREWLNAKTAAERDTLVTELKALKQEMTDSLRVAQ